MIATGYPLQDIRDQSAILLCAAWSVPQAKCHQITGEHHKIIEAIYTKTDKVFEEHVKKHEKAIDFGAGEPWKDVEADEVDLGKIVDVTQPAASQVQWEQWGGVVARGDPASLVLTRLDPMRTTARAPGPGPIRKRDWAPIASRLLKNRRVILHTDGARAYKMTVPGVVHDNVNGSAAPVAAIRISTVKLETRPPIVLSRICLDTPTRIIRSTTVETVSLRENRHPAERRHHPRSLFCGFVTPRRGGA